MTLAAAYLRVSGKTQIQGDGFPRQQASIQHYAQQNGIQIVSTREEKGVSGTVDGMNRPTWAELIADIVADKSGPQIILIEKLDRLARDLMIQEHIIASLRLRQITLISVAEPDLCINDPSRKLLRQIMGAIAEYDKTMIVEKLRAAKTRLKAKDGRKTDGAYAYGCHPRKPQETYIVGRMRVLQASGQRPDQIALQLNQENVPSRRGGIWHPLVVARVLARQEVR